MAYKRHINQIRASINQINKTFLKLAVDWRKGGFQGQEAFLEASACDACSSLASSPSSLLCSFLSSSHLSMVPLSGQCCAQTGWLRFHMSNADVSPSLGLSVGEQVMLALSFVLFFAEQLASIIIISCLMLYSLLCKCESACSPSACPLTGFFLESKSCVEQAYFHLLY